MKFWTLIGLYFIRKNRTLRNRKPDYSVFATSTSSLILFYLSPLIPFSPSSCFKTPWIFKSLNLAHVMFMFWNCRNQIVRNMKSEHLVFSVLPNLVINGCHNCVRKIFFCLRKMIFGIMARCVVIIPNIIPQLKCGQWIGIWYDTEIWFKTMETST
jgi:hypothetical protein